MDDLISRKKLLKDLAGMLDVCTGAGDPFLAAMIRKAMECVERQPVAQDLRYEIVKDNDMVSVFFALHKELAAARKKDFVKKPLAYALYQVWRKADTGKL